MAKKQWKGDRMYVTRGPYFMLFSGVTWPKLAFMTWIFWLTTKRSSSVAVPKYFFPWAWKRVLGLAPVAATVDEVLDVEDVDAEVEIVFMTVESVVEVEVRSVVKVLELLVTTVRLLVLVLEAILELIAKVDKVVVLGMH
jgi:hypothetical protein